MTSVAPICPVSRDQPVANQPPPPLLPVTHALDLPSLVQAVNAIGRNLALTMGPGLPANNLRPATVPQPKVTPTTIQQQWYETGRNTNDGFIYNYDQGKFDKSEKVEVVRIYEIDFSPAGSMVNQGMAWKWQEQPYNDGALQ